MLEIVLDGNRAEFAPGEVISGVVRWDPATSPSRLGIALAFRTEGRGTQDSASVAELDLDAQSAGGEAAFRFTAPRAPYTFDGTLISLRWFLLATSRKDNAEFPITLSPWVKIIRLQQVKSPDIHDLLARVKGQQQQ